MATAKPKIFIGSSVEGIGVAYAVQQNLRHDAETTVWDQGVFELSATTMESLEKALSTADFGIFVFSPDDVASMRKESVTVIRDNVLFEMGLFVGKLGRGRVFFLLPEGVSIHIPSDLLGVTPGKYDPNRTDKSMQAATGPACHDIRLKIKALGAINPDQTAPSLPAEAEEKEQKTGWLHEFIAKNYASARQKLAADVDDGLTEFQKKAWIVYCEYKEDPETNIERFFDLSKSHPAEIAMQTLLANFLRWEKVLDPAIRLLTSLPESIRDNPEIQIMLARCQIDDGDRQSAIDTLKRSDPWKHPSVALELAGELEADGQKSQAIDTILSSLKENRRNKALRLKIARLYLEENGENLNIALHLLADLADEDPSNFEHLGYLGNSCLSASLYDKALECYKSALAVAPTYNNQWLVQNIGNLYFSKGLPTEALIHLESSAESQKRSDYTHDRIARSIRLKEEEAGKFSEKRRDGLARLRAAISAQANAVEAPVQSRN